MQVASNVGVNESFRDAMLGLKRLAADGKPVAMAPEHNATARLGSWDLMLANELH